MTSLRHFCELIIRPLEPTDSRVGWLNTGLNVLKAGIYKLRRGLAVITQIRSIVVRERRWLSEDDRVRGANNSC